MKKQSSARTRKSSGKKAPRRGKIAGASAGTGRSPGRRDWEEVGTFYKPLKKPITLRLDADILAWFKAQGRGYQTRINRVLRRLMLEQGKRGPR
ncbi:MAG TPA: BrnA antitoxin family protein [Terriglobales bacterium]|nr:BrnA antitoxin family protein [Terriglobales bacterium]